MILHRNLPLLLNDIPDIVTEKLRTYSSQDLPIICKTALEKNVSIIWVMCLISLKLFIIRMAP